MQRIGGAIPIALGAWLLLMAVISSLITVVPGSQAELFVWGGMLAGGPTGLALIALGTYLNVRR